MKLFFISHYFWPEEVGTSVQSTEMADDLAASGHSLKVLTAFPHYPAGEIFPGYKVRLFQRDKRTNYEILRSYIFITKSKVLWRRLLNYGSFSLSPIISGLMAKGRPDIIYVDMPPLPMGMTGYLLSRLYGAKLALTIHDVEPERAVRLGLFKNATLIRFLEWLEQFTYRKADGIAVVGEALKRNLIFKGVPEEKIRIIPTWTDPNRIRPLEKFNEFRGNFAGPNDFLVLYSGNIGYTSALEPLIYTAKELISNEYIKFLVVGDGVKKPKIEKLVRDLNLSNVDFLPFQPFEKLSSVMAAADVCVVSLDADMSAYSVPGKTYTAMAAARPILALAEPENDIVRIIQQAQCGVSVDRKNIGQICETIQNMRSAKGEMENMGNNGRAYLMKHLTRNFCVKKHERFLRDVIASF